MKKISERFRKVFESKILVGILYGIGIMLVLFLVFTAGMTLGFHRASFGQAWQKNYERNFGIMSENSPFQTKGPGAENIPNAYGAVGTIVKIALPTIIVADKDNTEKTIVIENNTDIRERRENIKSSDLKIGNFIVVLGSPDSNGEIDASLIRVMPAPNLLFNNNKTGVVPLGN